MIVCVDYYFFEGCVYVYFILKKKYECKYYFLYICSG